VFVFSVLLIAFLITTVFLNTKRANTTLPSSTAATTGYVQFSQTQPGISFRYPKDWGEVIVKHEPINGHPKEEPSFPYIYTFSHNKAELRLFPRNWTFAPPSASDGWTWPLIQSSKGESIATVKNKIKDYGMIVNESADELIYMYYGPMGYPGIVIQGIKALPTPIADASYIELYILEDTIDKNCLSNGQATGSCISASQKEQLQQVLSSVSAD